MLAGERGGRGSSLCFFLLLFFLWLDVFERVKAATSVFSLPGRARPPRRQRSFLLPFLSSTDLARALSLFSDHSPLSSTFKA